MKDIIEKARDLALAQIKHYSLPSLINFQTSNDQGQRLAGLLRIDKDIVMLGTMLMDLKLGEAISKGVSRQHIRMSAVF